MEQNGTEWKRSRCESGRKEPKRRKKERERESKLKTEIERECTHVL